MKRYFYYTVILLILSCSSDDRTGSTDSTQSLEGQFAIYDNVIDALANHGPYANADGTLVSLQKGEDVHVHVQVSPKISNQSSHQINQLVKKTLVEASFKVFAHTGIESFQISAVPIDISSSEPPFIYLTEFSVSAQIQRKTVLKILEKHVLIRDLKKLYTYDAVAEVWYSNNNFELLQSIFLEEVFVELVK